MTLPTLDWRSLGAKLRRCRELLEQLQAVGEVDERRLVAEPLIALALERILTQLVELAFATNSHVAVAVLGRAPDSYSESFALAAQAGMIDPELTEQLRPSVGLRNVLVHDYLAVDQSIVAASAALADQLYGEYVRQVAGFLSHAADH